MNPNRTRTSYYPKHRGMVVIMLTAGMAVLLAIMGLAIDFGHAYVNKTRLQNLADTLALTGAKTLNESQSVTQAQSAIDTLFTININGSGNTELQANLSLADLVVEYSNQLDPFVPGGAAPRYVRVMAGSLQLQSWFVRTLGITEIPVSAVAVGGPSSTLSSYVCDTSPIMLCGNPDYDPSTNSNSNFWGYLPGMVQLLKAGSENNSYCIGPGNYQLVSLGGTNSGADEVREVLAGNYEGCTNFSEGIETKPGNSAGPSIQGLNTRFGEYLGQMKKRKAEFPPDTVTIESDVEINSESGICQGGQVVDLSFDWNDYQQAVRNGHFSVPPPVGVTGRRILKVPIGDCSNSAEISGRTVIPYLGLGCFFLLKRIEGNSNGNLYGEFIKECMQDGIVDAQRETRSGPYKVILHENPVVL